MFFFFFYPLAIWFWLLLRFIVPLKGGHVFNVLAGAVLLLVVEKFLWFDWLGGEIFGPDLPGWILLAMGWLYAFVILLFFCIVAQDALAFFRWAVASFTGWKCPLPLSVRQWSAALCVVLSAVTTWGVWQAFTVPEVQPRDVAIRHLSPQWNGAKIAVLSDLHACSYTTAAHTRAIVEKVNALKPDFILLLGDTVDGPVSSLRPCLLPLAGLHAKRAVLGVTRNHEYYANWSAWRPVFRDDFKIGLLANSHRVFGEGTNALVMAGVNDLSAGYRGDEPSNLAQALKGAPAGAPVILLSHQPGQARLAAEHGVALQLSGHTHGGMIPLVSQLVASANGGFVKGFYHVGETTLYVSPGSGLWNGFPIRLFDPAEITELRLSAASRVAPRGAG